MDIYVYGLQKKNRYQRKRIPGNENLERDNISFKYTK